MQRLGARCAVILGGTSALSQGVVFDLKAAGVTTVERLGAGGRFGTAALVAGKLSDTVVGQVRALVDAGPLPPAQLTADIAGPFGCRSGALSSEHRPALGFRGDKSRFASYAAQHTGEEVVRHFECSSDE